MDAFINGLHATCFSGVSGAGAVVSGCNALDLGANLEQVLTLPPEGDGDFRTSKSSALEWQQKKDPRHVVRTKDSIQGDVLWPCGATSARANCLRRVEHRTFIRLLLRTSKGKNCEELKGITAGGSRLKARCLE